MDKFVLDVETFPNFFSCSITQADGPFWWYFEISDWRDDRKQFFEWLRDAANSTFIGFNLVNFDGPVIQHFIRSGGKATAYDLYQKAQSIITSQDEDKFANQIRPSDRYHNWLCLLKIHHFDNKARMTSLKALEFEMRMDSVEDLPFGVGILLTKDQAATVRAYNEHDVVATKKFYGYSLDKIALRDELSKTYDRDFTNYSDVKIGTTIFKMELEKAGVQLYAYGKAGRTPIQTKRSSIALKECIPSWVEFQHPEFKRVHQWLLAQTITETKSVFDNLIAHINGLDFVFGTGGLHASVENTIVTTRNDLLIKSKDVSSYYPNLAIHHHLYPEHLTEKFCEIYKHLYEKRKTYPKGSAFNAAYKLALNGSFGVSNSPFSVFYDPRFMLSITLSGQMMLAMLVDKLLSIPTLKMVMTNTDGIEYLVHPDYEAAADEVCRQWEQLTQLELEGVNYRRMFILNVNNYLCEDMTGNVKKKGAFLTKLDFHQNGSALIVPKVAEQVLLHGASIRDTVLNWPDKFDFFCRVKVPRSSRLEGDGQPLPNLCRYYVSEGGVTLTKIVPPLAKKPGVWRRIGVESGWTVCPCNHVRDAVLPVNHQYYINEIEKLCLPLKEHHAN